MSKYKNLIFSLSLIILVVFLLWVSRPDKGEYLNNSNKIENLETMVSEQASNKTPEVNNEVTEIPSDSSPISNNNANTIDQPDPSVLQGDIDPNSFNFKKYKIKSGQSVVTLIRANSIVIGDFYRIYNSEKGKVFDKVKPNGIIEIALVPGSKNNIRAIKYDKELFVLQDDYKVVHKKLN